MGKRMILIVGVIALLFVGIWFLTNLEIGELTYNPYGEEKEISRETRDTLKGKDYLHQINYEDFNKKVIEGEEDVFVYVFSPTCIHCQKFNPTVNEIFGDNIKYYRLNVLEIPEVFQDLDIEGTPTMLYFENGKEKDRMVGNRPPEELKMFIEKNNKQK